MRLINTKAHALFDYLMGGILIAYPRIFANDQYSPEAGKVSMIIGILLIVTALSTNFELSLLKVINLKIHYFIDLLLGAVLATSPLLFNYSLEIHKQHLVFGMAVFVFSILSDRILSREVHLLMNRRTKKLSPAPRQRKSGFPGLKLIIDPFYILSIKALKKTDSFFKSKEA